MTNVDDDNGGGEIRCAGFVGANASTTTAHDVPQMAAAVTTEHVVAIGRRLGCLCMFVIVMVQTMRKTNYCVGSLFLFPP